MTNEGNRVHVNGRMYILEEDLVSTINLLSLAEVIDEDTKVHDVDSDSDVELVPLLRQARAELTKMFGYGRL